MLQAIMEIRSNTDRDFLDNLYRTYYAMLQKLAFSIIQNKESSEDIVINAMLSLFSLVPKLRDMDEHDLVAYLRKTVRHAAYKYYKAARRKSVMELPLDHDILFSLPSEDIGPAEQLIQNEFFQMHRAAIASLPEKDRRVLYLRYAADLTSVEIAELTGAPSAAAVREHLFRVRHKVLFLRDDLRHEGGNSR